MSYAPTVGHNLWANISKPFILRLGPPNYVSRG